MIAKVKVLDNNVWTYLSNLTIGEWFLFNGNLCIAIGFDVGVKGVEEAIMMPSGRRQLLDGDSLVEKVTVNIIAKKEIAEE